MGFKSDEQAGHGRTAAISVAVTKMYRSSRGTVTPGLPDLTLSCALPVCHVQTTKAAGVQLKFFAIWVWLAPIGFIHTAATRCVMQLNVA